jgi:hypothetical protein
MRVKEKIRHAMACRYIKYKTGAINLRHYGKVFIGGSIYQDYKLFFYHSILLS